MDGNNVSGSVAELFMRVSWPRTELEEKRAEGKDRGMKAKIMAAGQPGGGGGVGWVVAEGWSLL